MIAVNISIVVVDKKFKSHGELMCTGKILQACTCSLGGGGGGGGGGRGLLAIHCKRLVNKLLA